MAAAHSSHDNVRENDCFFQPWKSFFFKKRESVLSSSLNAPVTTDLKKYPYEDGFVSYLSLPHRGFTLSYLLKEARLKVKPRSMSSFSTWSKRVLDLAGFVAKLQDNFPKQ